MTKLRQTTNKQLKYFAARVQYWAARLGLSDWRIMVGRKKLIDCVAQCEMYSNSHGANIFLSKEIPEESSEWDNKFLNKVALHEVAHILLCDFRETLQQHLDHTTAEHAIIRRLENLLT